MAEHEQKLLGLLGRLLHLNEDLHAQNDRLHVLVQSLSFEYRSLRSEFARKLQDDAVEKAAADVLLDAAMDELLERSDRPRGRQ